MRIASDTGRDASVRLASLQRGFFAPGNDARPWLEGWYPQWRAAYGAARSSPPKSTWWPVSHAPILDLQGELDPWRPAHTREELREMLGDKVTVSVIGNASHALVEEQSGAIADAIVAWMRGLAQ